MSPPPRTGEHQKGPVKLGLKALSTRQSGEPINVQVKSNYSLAESII